MLTSHLSLFRAGVLHFFVIHFLAERTQKAIIAAVEEGRAKGCNEERAAIGYQLGLLRAKASPQEALVYDQIVMLLSKRARS